MIRTVTVCDHCHLELPEGKGFEIHGNVMSVKGGGFIGNNICRALAAVVLDAEDVACFGPDKPEVTLNRPEVVVRVMHLCGHCMGETVHKACESMGIPAFFPYLPKPSPLPVLVGADEDFDLQASSPWPPVESPEGSAATEPENVGMEDGARCNRGGCEGTIEFKLPEDCSCHLSPPCEPCVRRSAQCGACGAYPGEEKP